MKTIADDNARRAAESILAGSSGSIRDVAARFDQLFTLWIGKRDFPGLLSILVDAHADDCLKAGAILLRHRKDLPEALRYWRAPEQALEGLKAAVDLRKSMGESEFLYPENGTLPVRYLLNLVRCLVLSGNRAGVAEVRATMNAAPFFRSYMEGRTDPDIAAAELNLLFAAWDGDLALVKEWISHLDKEYRRWKIPEVYLRMWQSLGERDARRFSELLSDAQSGYRAMSRKRDYGIWGGSKRYNDAMIDVYVTVVLKIARDLGISSGRSTEDVAEIWPIEVIEYWS